MLLLVLRFIHVEVFVANNCHRKVGSGSPVAVTAKLGRVLEPTGRA
jgi:hypothetical protein